MPPSWPLRETPRCSGWLFRGNTGAVRPLQGRGSHPLLPICPQSTSFPSYPLQIENKPDQKSAHYFYKGLDSKHFKLCESHHLPQPLSSDFAAGGGQDNMETHGCGCTPMKLCLSCLEFELQIIFMILLISFNDLKCKSILSSQTAQEQVAGVRRSPCHWQMPRCFFGELGSDHWGLPVCLSPYSIFVQEQLLLVPSGHDLPPRVWAMSVFSRVHAGLRVGPPTGKWSVLLESSHQISECGGIYSWFSRQLLCYLTFAVPREPLQLNYKWNRLLTGL